MSMGEEEQAKLRALRYDLRANHQNFFDKVSWILFRHDPIGIASKAEGGAADEYDAEVGTLIPRLQDASSPAELRRIVWEEFLRWFGDPRITGPEAKYGVIAHEIWEAWKNYQLANPHMDLRSNNPE